MYTLRPLSKIELRNIFDQDAINILEYFMVKSIFSQPELSLWQKKLPIHIPKEHIEQWITQALWVKSIWAWSYPIDVYNAKKKWWADIKMLSAKIDKDWNLTNDSTWETSLAQKFTGAWSILDGLFKWFEYDKIRTLWIDIFTEKLKTVTLSNNLDKIYYFMLIRAGTKFYLLGMEVYPKNASNSSVDEERTTQVSVYLKDFIHPDLWNVKIYKAKKRLELRLTPLNWKNKNYLIEFDTEFLPENIDLRNYLKSGGDMQQFAKHKSQKYFK